MYSRHARFFSFLHASFAPLRSITFMILNRSQGYHDQEVFAKNSSRRTTSLPWSSWLMPQSPWDLLPHKKIPCQTRRQVWSTKSRKRVASEFSSHCHPLTGRKAVHASCLTRQKSKRKVLDKADSKQKVLDLPKNANPLLGFSAPKDPCPEELVPDPPLCDSLNLCALQIWCCCE